MTGIQLTMDDQPPIEYPIDGMLDLHAFRPQEIKELICDYLIACHQKGIYSVRIVHGKGTGTLRDCVHAQLSKNSLVQTFRLGDGSSGEWGATLVRLWQ